MAKVKGEVPNIDDAPSIEPPSGGEGWHTELPRVKFEAFLGKVITIKEVEWRDSAFAKDDEGPKKQYALMVVQCPDSVPGTNVSDEGDESPVIVEPGLEVTTSTGRIRICDQIRKAVTLPVKGEVAIGGQTKGGFDIWELRPVD